MNQHKIDPICGMEGKIPAYGEWFCSSYCVRKYEQEKNLPALEEKSCVPLQCTPLYKNKLVLTLLSILSVFIISFFVSVLSMFRHHFFEYARIVWKALLAGFLIGGLIEVYIPRSYISNFLAKKNWTTILNAAILGFIFSGCSHGCLAITFELYKKGASIPAVISFLLASPWANLSITFLLISFFGWKGFLIISAALMISLFVGALYHLLDQKGWIEKNPHTVLAQPNFSVLNDLRKRWNSYRFSLTDLFYAQVPQVLKGSWHLAEMVLWWVLIGVTAASLAGSLVRPEFFREWMGKDFFGIFATLGFATVLEVCSEGTAPLAFEIYRQTGAFGNAFVFLMAGVVTDYTEIGLLWSNIGKKTALWLPALTIPIIVAIGILLNLFF